MNKRSQYILLILLCLTGSMQAQVFESRKLAEIGMLFPQNCLPANDSVFQCPQIIHEKSFVIKYNYKHEITHLGISLFSPESKEIINKPICNFIERMMLELIVQPSTIDAVSKLKQYRVRLQKNGDRFGQGLFTTLNGTLDNMQNPVQFILRKDSCYTAYWKYGDNNELIMSFPISRELIFGTDKKESDQITGEMFMDFDCNTTVENQPNVNISKLQVQNNSDLYILKGSIYLAANINSDTYYQRSVNKYQLVYNSYHPAESLANLLITRQGKSLTLKITHRMYGGFTPEFNIPLSQFFCLFNSNFSTYCVLGQVDSANVQVSAVLYNNDFGYIHLLRIKTTSKQLFSKNGILNADLYTNIPQHNLKNLLTTYP